MTRGHYSTQLLPCFVTLPQKQTLKLLDWTFKQCMIPITYPTISRRLVVLFTPTQEPSLFWTGPRTIMQRVSDTTMILSHSQKWQVSCTSPKH
ncbi:ORF270 [White spot syndrome virus]|uniref:Wsv225 n=3 Tax=White spot syndrome virus TaxID=342409 RepID=Q8VAZ1_WSSVS|nr:wsv225 [Shrimp white spot syndrome virus]AFX59602.1 wsv225 [White spot syndrome virus]AAL33229.1 wsv225 [Shrimp white spot syndrome virus]AAL89148.1 WSSV280 [Shrimp white spot syndrome virus]ATU83711.1 ORF270 [White spot syndrome virus]AWQ60396.1 wsv225 [Shrimp white spot syndrome virus]